MRFRRPALGLSSSRLIFLVALWITLACNVSFFTQLLRVYPFNSAQAPHLGSLALVVLAINALILALCAVGRATKPVLMVFLLLASLAAYFMDSYGIVISDDMLQNAVQTNPAEARDLMTGKLLGYVLLLGALPALLVAKLPLHWRGWRTEALARIRLIALLLIAVALPVAALSSFYASFLREHKSLRSYANPSYFMYSALKYARQALGTAEQAALVVVGADAAIPSSDLGRELIIVVVGETARADRFSINGYPRETTPQLQAAQAVSFTNFWACGTSTAVSVPCMFSMSGAANFDLKHAGGQENLLDVLSHAGVNVLWLDNNSDSKETLI